MRSSDPTGSYHPAHGSRHPADGLRLRGDSIGSGDPNGPSAMASLVGFNGWGAAPPPRALIEAGGPPASHLVVIPPSRPAGHKSHYSVAALRAAPNAKIYVIPWELIKLKHSGRILFHNAGGTAPATNAAKDFKAKWPHEAMFNFGTRCTHKHVEGGSASTPSDQALVRATTRHFGPTAQAPTSSRLTPTPSS